MTRTAKKATKVQVTKVQETKVQETQVVPLITRQEYIADIKVRWQIHTEEVAKLGEDMQKAYAFLLPFLKNTKEISVETYQQLVAKYRSMRPVQ